MEPHQEIRFRPVETLRDIESMNGQSANGDDIIGDDEEMMDD